MKNLNIPNHSNIEKWKYTNINQFDSYSFDFQPIDKTVNIKCKKNEIILHNGRLHSFGKDLLDNNIVVCNINDAIKNNKNNFSKLFNQIYHNHQDNHFKLQNISWNTGFFLYIPKNLIQTILIVNIIDQGKENNFLNSKNFIHIDKYAKCKITYREQSNHSSCIHNISEIYIEDNAELELFKITNKINNSKQIYNCAVDLNRNAKLIYNAIDLSGNLIKNNYHVNLNKPGSSCYFNGFNTGNHKDYIDNYVEICHNDKHTVSNLNYNIISKDSAQSILFAKAIIGKNSSGCEAYQKNQNIILSKNAIIHSNPQLEIYNDDVKCAHGSTTGQIDDDAVHYMRTRGISESDAKKLILHSFLTHIIQKVSLEDLRLELNNKIESYLSSVN